MTHSLYSVVTQVDATHKYLGKMIALAFLTTRARKCLLTVAPPGCGKSTLGKVLKAYYKHILQFEGITVLGMGQVKDLLEGYQGLVLVDDLAKADTIYSRISTLGAFAGLVYDGSVSKHTKAADLDIAGFTGSCVINMQPALLPPIIASSTWDALVRDKTLRYYHLYRPLEVCTSPPLVDFPLVKFDSKAIVLPDNLPDYDKLWLIARCQWSKARAKEHLDSLLIAAAGLDGREVADTTDVGLLLDLLRPMALERYTIRREGLDQPRRFEFQLAYLLVSILSYRNLKASMMAEDYELSLSTVYRVLKEMEDYVEMTGHNPHTVKPTEKLAKIIREVRCYP